MKEYKLVLGQNYSGVRKINALGFISYPNWRITGAVRWNNFGHIVERKSFFEFDTIKDWRYKNGKQKWHIEDLDYGTYRIWRGTFDIWPIR